MSKLSVRLDHQRSERDPVGGVRTPHTICDAEADLFFKGQPQTLFDHLTYEKKLITFTSEEVAGAHCEVGAGRLSNARMFDWLDEVLGV